MANKVEITMTQHEMNKQLAKMGPVQDALRDHAEKIAAKARALLAQHRRTGAHHIDYEGHRSDVSFGHIDHYVVMKGPAPVSVEYGHRTKDGKWVNGLYVMTRAMI
jgi:hypothetical protein